MRTYIELRRDVERAIAVQDSSMFERDIEELDAMGTDVAAALANRLRGLLTLHQGEREVALELFHKAIAVYERLGEVAEAARVLSNTAQVHVELGDASRAFDIYKDVQSRFEELGDVHGVAHTLNAVGWTQFHIGRTAEAMETLLKALQHSLQLDDSAGSARVLSNLSTLCVQLGRHAEAMEYATRALAFSESINNMHGVADLLNSLGVICYHTAQYPEAVDYYHRVLRIREQLNDVKGILSTLTNIGSVFNATGNTVQALVYYERAMAMITNTSDGFVMSRILGNIGIVHKKNGANDLALDHFRRALDAQHLNGDSGGRFQLQAHILDVLIITEQYEEADEMLALLDANTISDPSSIITVDLSRATLLERRDRLDEAKHALTSALALTDLHVIPELQIDVHRRLRDLALTQQDLAGYVSHNNDYTRITNEVVGRETVTKLAIQEKQREMEAREREHEKQLAVLHSTLPKEVADRVARGEVVNDHYENAYD